MFPREVAAVAALAKALALASNLLVPELGVGSRELAYGVLSYVLDVLIRSVVVLAALAPR